MNQGGEPGQDDYGLPSVDVEIPDDARDLDPDVQAYRREQRALRRQLRSQRWVQAPLRRYGSTRPLVAGFLLLALASAALLVIFSTSQNFGLAPQPGGTAAVIHHHQRPPGSARPAARHRPLATPPAAGRPARTAPVPPAATGHRAGRHNLRCRRGANRLSCRSRK